MDIENRSNISQKIHRYTFCNHFNAYRCSFVRTPVVYTLYFDQIHLHISLPQTPPSSHSLPCSPPNFISSVHSSLSPISFAPLGMAVGPLAKATYQRPLPRRKLTLSPWRCQSSLHEPFPLQAGMFTGMILHRSCADNHSCCEFTSAAVLSYPEGWHFTALHLNLRLLTDILPPLR